MPCHAPTEHAALPEASAAAIVAGRGGWVPESGEPLNGSAPHARDTKGCLFYTNLKGKDGRVSNALPELSLEYRLPLGNGPFGIPWRFAVARCRRTDRPCAGPSVSMRT
ncbi:MAG TPA: hypothetical protein VGI10_24200 [Polyangiaceae bacterium]